MDKKIIIKGTRVNNLKNISVEIPQNQLVVITGLSGSGKSSLAFDTLYAEGQRRYVESLSSYARQFLGKITKPDVDFIQNIPPAIAIEQRVISRNPRSTVGTTTEIYEYFKLLYARVGKTTSPVSGKLVKRENLNDVLKFAHAIPLSAKVYIAAPIVIVSGRTLTEQLEILQKQGYSRLICKKEILDIDTLLQTKKTTLTSLYILIDRFKASNIMTEQARFADSVQIAFNEGKGSCMLQVEDNEDIKQKIFNDSMEMDGIKFEEPSINLFSFNNPYGACPICGGTGIVDGIDPDLVIPDTSLSVFEGAVACWHGEKLKEWQDYFIKYAVKQQFPPHRAIDELTKEEYNLLWNGDPDNKVLGIQQFFEFVEKQRYKIQYRVLATRYRGRTTCPDCQGTRLRKDANYVKIGDKSISNLITMPITELHKFLSTFKFKDKNDEIIAKDIVKELINRLSFIMDVGLGYLTLNRAARSLSGGESQRINLATSLGSSLVGSLYILDEPSIGLHPRDTERLIHVLQQLRDIGNTVVIVEHDEDIIKHADYIIDIGPEAGRLGGEIVFSGTYPQLIKKSNNLTAAYIRGMEAPLTDGNLCIQIPDIRRKWRNYIQIFGAKEHNLKNVNVKIPLQILTVITGVSGSGKSTLIKDILYPAIQKKLSDTSEKMGKHSKVEADWSKISEVIVVDQNPIGKSSRSNPAIYIKAFDDIRELFANQPLSKQRNYKPGFFSFNTVGGRCDECDGEGVIHVSMQFMADVDLVCSECHGKHYKDEILEVKIAGKDISDILDMTINQAIEFFSSLKEPNRLSGSIIAKLSYLQDVGLGYLKMGQPSQTLSGGESQRVKLAFFLSQGDAKQNILFIFDEPTTGLHFHDINKLYSAFNQLIEKGNSIIVIEHNPEIIKCADWIIDLGPDGGEAGGHIVCEGTPEDIVKCKKSYTGKVLTEKLKHK